VCLIGCDLETLRMRRPWPALGCFLQYTYLRSRDLRLSQRCCRKFKSSRMLRSVSPFQCENSKVPLTAGFMNFRQSVLEIKIDIFPSCIFVTSRTSPLLAASSFKHPVRGGGVLYLTDCKLISTHDSITWERIT
jgi:hypothetical protein